MEAPASVSLFPVDVWKEISSHMTTAEWAKAARTCRAMSQVHPRNILVWSMDANQAELHWTMRHCSEAEDLILCLDGAAWKRLQHVMIPSDWNIQRLHHLVLDFTPFEDDMCSGLTEAHLPWLAQFLARATQLKLLQLEAVSIDTRMLQVQPNLKHLRLGFRLPVQREVCQYLQNLHSLETLHLEVLFESIGEDYKVVKISGLDFTGCRHLRAISLSMLEPMKLRLPAGCSLSAQRDILCLDEEGWKRNAANLHTCRLRSNAYKDDQFDMLGECPDLAGTWCGCQG